MWKAAIEVAADCYRVTSEFPKSEIYGMTGQVRRAATSIAANIAEGHGRETTASFVQFLRVAQGSLKELETHLILSQRIALLQQDPGDQLLTKCDEIGRMLRSLIRSLQERQ